MGLLALEGFGPVESLRRDGPRLAAVAARLGLESLKAVLVVAALPTGQGRHADLAPAGVGDLVVAGGNQLLQTALAARLVLAPQQGQDERVPEKCNVGATFLGIDSVWHGSTSMFGVGPSIPADQTLEKMRNSVGGGVVGAAGSDHPGGQIA